MERHRGHGKTWGSWKHLGTIERNEDSWKDLIVQGSHGGLWNVLVLQCTLYSVYQGFFFRYNNGGTGSVMPCYHKGYSCIALLHKGYSCITLFSQRFQLYYSAIAKAIPVLSCYHTVHSCITLLSQLNYPPIFTIAIAVILCYHNNYNCITVITKITTVL